jgi:CRP-like cAMP-binding protein
VNEESFTLLGDARVYASEVSNALERWGCHEARCIYVVGPGKAFGEMALVDGEPRSAELRAAKDSEFMLLSQDNFRTLCCSQPTIGLKMLMQISRSLSQRLRRVSGQLVDYLGN